MPARNHIEVVAKAMSVLEVLAEGQGPKTLRDISAGTGLVKSTAYRILFTLRELGYVDRNDFRGTYSLNLKVLALAQGAKSSVTLTRVARPHMERLRDEVDESVWLAERRSDGVSLVDVAEASHPLRLLLKLGDNCPLHASAAGKSILAFMDPEEREAALARASFERFTAKTKTDPVEIREEIHKVRALGYSFNDEETVQGGIALGTPVFDASRRVFAALSVTAPSSRWRLEQLDNTARRVMDCASQISREFERVHYRHNASRVNNGKLELASGV